MSIHETTTSVDARQAESEITDGRLTMSAVSDLSTALGGDDA